ncbi:hypothetical protein [Kitasatospora cineracea]|uniref:hypothetical protein n=1 Tax=Kitasatospora cineracea TaxID=88074 RepID=UPI0037F2B20B
MTAPEPRRGEHDVEVLLFLVDRAERGPLLPVEAELLRAAVRDMATYRRWCGQWAERTRAALARSALLRRALRRAVDRAQQRAPRPGRPGPGAYVDLLAAELLDGYALARAARRLDPVTRRTRTGP